MGFSVRQSVTIFMYKPFIIINRCYTRREAQKSCKALQDKKHAGQKMLLEGSGMTYTMDMRWKENNKSLKQAEGIVSWLVLGPVFAGSGLLHCSHLVWQCWGRQVPQCRERALLPITLPTCSVPSLCSHPSAACACHCVTSASLHMDSHASLDGHCLSCTTTAAIQQCWECHSHFIHSGRATHRRQLRIIDRASRRVTFHLNHKKMHRGWWELLWQGDLSCQLWLCANFFLSWHNCWLAEDQT